MVQFVKAIVEEASLKGPDVLWANARECRMCDVWLGQKWDGTNSSGVKWPARVWIDSPEVAVHVLYSTACADSGITIS